jgi:membrane-associated phospholipid phosphatase
VSVSVGVWFNPAVRRLLIPIVLLLLCVGLGLLVRAEPAPGFDRDLTNTMQRAFDGPTHDALWVTTRVLYTPWNFLIGAALAVVAVLMRGYRAGFVVLLSMVLLLGAVEIVKPAFGRLRPEASAPAGEARSARSYVSGHVGWTAATLTAFALVMTRRRKARILAISLAVLATAWVATSRLHLGRHYLTDALGSALLATAVVLRGDAVLPRSPPGDTSSGPPPAV